MGSWLGLPFLLHLLSTACAQDVIAPPEPPAARMVRTQVARRDVRDARVLQAMREVPRDRFMPVSVRHLAWQDGPVPIGHGQTISQPYIVGLMLELLEVEPTDRVLEVGTGLGYQAAVLSRLAREVWTMEIVVPLCEEARATLAREGFGHVRVVCGDGWAGLPDQAPFDGIVVAAAPDRVPPALKAQLAVGGRLVLPVGPVHGPQELRVVRRTSTGFEERSVLPVAFVPMTGGSKP
ncbi:MAG: protein-L-isoaspartate(D-aspartate) O-methyltransferase [Deltaproteobacteria bacterium]|nr:protein-L-isoaspartate(D-aspartate) O-methyltransferase [Deltaproteobacteria bacterium]